MAESLDSIGPLTAVLVDPNDPEHAKQLILQRIKGGRNAEQVAQWLSEIRSGTRQHYLYYETASLPAAPNAPHPSPIGSAAIGTLLRHGPKIVGPLPSSKVHLSGLFVDPQRRGREYGNLLMEHRLRVAFADPQVQTVMLDTPRKFESLLAWHRRLGFEPTGETAVLYGDLAEENLPMHVRGMSENDRELVFVEMGREAWEERYGSVEGKRSRGKLDKEKVKGGIPNELPKEPKYSDEKAKQILESMTIPTFSTDTPLRNDMKQYAETVKELITST